MRWGRLCRSGAAHLSLKASELSRCVEPWADLQCLLAREAGTGHGRLFCFQSALMGMAQGVTALTVKAPACPQPTTQLTHSGLL